MLSNHFQVFTKMMIDSNQSIINKFYMQCRKFYCIYNQYHVELSSGPTEKDHYILFPDNDYKTIMFAILFWRYLVNNLQQNIFCKKFLILFIFTINVLINEVS